MSHADCEADAQGQILSYYKPNKEIFKVFQAHPLFIIRMGYFFRNIITSVMIRVGVILPNRQTSAARRGATR